MRIKLPICVTPLSLCQIIVIHNMGYWECSHFVQECTMYDLDIPVQECAK